MFLPCKHTPNFLLDQVHKAVVIVDLEFYQVQVLHLVIGMILSQHQEMI